MKNALIYSLCLAAASSTLFAETIRVDELRTPASPAFVLLGVEPSAVERPSTPSELGVSVLTQAGAEGGAIEFAPYWLYDHSDLTFSQFQHAGFLQGLKQTFSMSLGSAEAEREEGGTTLTDINLGAGIRAHWVFGNSTNAFDKAVTALGDAQQEAARRDDRNLTEKEREKLDAETSKNLAKLAKKVTELARDGRVVVEVAAGATENLPESSWEKAQFGKWGLWITPSYRFTSNENRKIDLVVVGRYLDDRLAEKGDGETTDVGARLIREGKRVAFSAEYVHRFADENSERFALVTQYRFSEDLFLTATIGEDFGDEGEGRAIALFGLNFALGAPRVKAP